MTYIERHLESLDVDRLRESLGAVPPAAWSLPSSFVATGVHEGYRTAKPLDMRRVFGWALDGFAPVHDAWLTWLEPGGWIGPHCDAGPFLERWHVPIVASGRMCQAGVWSQGQPGVPFRVEQWQCHEVVNDGPGPRVHLLVDRDVVAVPGKARFVNFAEEAPGGLRGA